MKTLESALEHESNSKIQKVKTKKLFKNHEEKTLSLR